MIKKNKWKLIISSIIIMLPALLGIFADKILPEKIATHWNFAGEADGFMNPTLAFIISPTILLAVHWLGIILATIIDKNTEQNKKVASLIYFIMPIMSLFVNGIIFAIALGNTPNTIFVAIIVLLSAMLIFIGNYLPKTTRNRTMGIKIKWTLANDENWQATHRFAGKVSVFAGILCLFAILLPIKSLPLVFFVIIIATAIAPTIYSYRFYKKQLSDGSVTKESTEKTYNELMKHSKPAAIVTAIIIVAILVFVSILMFTGNIEATLSDTSLLIEADFFEDLTLNYEDIASIEYRENGVDGTRYYGFGSAKLLMGIFSNEEFGNYTRYTYTGNNPCIVIKANDKTIVLGLDNETETKTLYSAIVEKVSK